MSSPLVSAKRAVLFSLALAACGPTPHESAEVAPRPEGVLHAPHELGADFTLDHQVVIRWQGREASFRGILEKRGDTLTLVALGPHGGRGFVLRQEGTTVAFESELPEALPFPPEHILMTLHRVWLLGIGRLGAGDPPLADGEHRVERDGEELIERWAGGRVMERTFRPLDGTPSGRFEITYEGGFDPTLTTSPRRIAVRDGWVGYELDASAISFTRLPSEGVPAPASE